MISSKINFVCLVALAVSSCMVVSSSAISKLGVAAGYPDCEGGYLEGANLVKLKSAIKNATPGPPVASWSIDRFFAENLIIVAPAKLHKGNRTFIAFASSHWMCGSGGCDAYVLEQRSGPDTGSPGYKLLADISPARLPISILPTIHNGWRDIGVKVAGGGIINGYIGALAYNGSSYNSNPTLPNVTRVKEGLGEILLGPPGASSEQCRLR